MVAKAAGATVSVPVQRDENVLCTITNTRKAEVKPELKPLVPVLECVVFRGATPEQAVWGYRNDNGFPVPAPTGAANGFAPLPADRGQPELFQPGRWTGILQTRFGSTDTLAWTLAGQTVTASRTSAHCTAIIELRKVTAPAGDPGVFNLLLNGQVLASGGNGTTAGPYTVGVGEGTVVSCRPWHEPGRLRVDRDLHPKRQAGGVWSLGRRSTARFDRRFRRLHLHQPPDHDPPTPLPPGPAPAAEAAELSPNPHHWRPNRRH